MRLPTPPAKYDATAMAATQRIIEQTDQDNLKKGKDLTFVKERIILTSPNGTRYALVVSNSGVLSTVAV